MHCVFYPLLMCRTIFFVLNVYSRPLEASEKWGKLSYIRESEVSSTFETLLLYLGPVRNYSI